MFKLFTLFLFQTALFANYQSTYIPDNVRNDFSEGKYEKYRAETIPTVTLVNLKNKLVFNADSTLTKSVSATPPNFAAIVAADVCKVDNTANYSSTIYEVDLPNGVVTCMYAAKGDLYNPMGLYKVFVPEVKAYYALDTKAAAQEKAAEVAAAEAQFTPLFEKKQEIIAQMNQDASTGFLTIPELLMAAVLTDDEIIDIEATKATGKFQLKQGFTSKFTNSGEIVDNSEYLLADAATIFEVYAGLGSVSMSFLMILVVGFAGYGGIRFFGAKAANKIDQTKDGGSTPYIAGLMVGVLLFFPVEQSDITVAQAEAGEYELLKTRYQEFEKFGYYTFSEWGKASAKVIIDAEIDALIRKSGLGTKEQIVSTWAQKVQSDKLSSFYRSNYDYCKDSVYQESSLFFDGKSVYSETEKGIFPSTEHWAFASYLARPMTDGFYDVSESGLLREGAAVAGYYPKFAFSSCGKADSLSDFHKERHDAFLVSYQALIRDNPTSNSKLIAIGEIFEFQYALYRDWGFLSILGLPVTKMQTENIGGLYKTGDNEVLNKLQQKIHGENKYMHSTLSSIPYLFIPGINSVFNIVKDNAIAVGIGSGATIAASQTEDGALSALLAVIGGAFGGAAAMVPGADAALGLAFAYQAAKILLLTLPMIGIVIVGLLRFIIIMLKIFAFHFLSLFLMPIMFIQKNVEAMGKFSVKILATMLEIPIFVLAIWLAITANSLIHTIGTVFGKKIMSGMLDTSLAQNSLNPSVEVAGANLTNLFTQMKIYFIDGFMEVAIAGFSIVIIYKLIITLHTELFQAIDLATSSAIDNSVESMKQAATGWGARI
ncbi:MAG TPA: hypothetical protein VLZ29_04455 [Sulfurimonas sp.]|uniref:hypothetical protein n=1 Tax=Sulfurimonas sp. TaxID=2022749 RepID=UPI002CA2EE3B|nr:hypothetical protein [Sulfurimonas sp.]HUH42342.1 hypothetical protein [Sulfurimonas sp.]